jgi:glycerol-3-phosphate acyltransferase PlsY
MKAVLVWIVAYLYGSIPFVDILARARSVNLKDVGSGNVGATNLMSVAGARVAVIGWLLDASKGLLPVMVARRLALSSSAAGLAGVCGAAGQCWPITLGFSGGRGISAFIGASYAIDPVCWLVALVPFMLGAVWRVVPTLAAGGRPLTAELRTGRTRSVPLGSLFGVLAFPTSKWLLGRRPLAPAVLLAAVILVRRLTAPLPDDVVEGPAEESRAIVYRLLYDRNTAA